MTSNDFWVHHASKVIDLLREDFRRKVKGSDLSFAHGLYTIAVGKYAKLLGTTRLEVVLDKAKKMAVAAQRRAARGL